MKPFWLLLLCLLSGLLLSLGWPANGFPWLLFISFVPLLFVEDYISQNKDRFSKVSILFYAYITFLSWNLLVTWWIYNSTIFGMIMAVLLNSALMSIVFWLFYFTKRTTKSTSLGYISLIVYWISFEYLHLDWDLSWPWLNLGNGFASYYKWVQWYEFTGVFGGTLWILIVNILFYQLIKKIIKQLKNKKIIILHSAILFFLLLSPILFSLVLYEKYIEKEVPINVTIIQPNIDPYNEQFISPPKEIIERIIKLTENGVDSTTNLVVCPESAIQEGVWEDQFASSPSILRIKKQIFQYPKTQFIVGLSTFKMYHVGELLPASVRKYDNGKWYDAYNTALFIDSSKKIQYYHKSKLVPGVEKMPFANYLKFLEKYAIDLGGTVGTLGVDKERKVFTTSDSTIKIATLICYESIYGEFVGEFVKNGATLIVIITNDGWWGNTPGYRQHFSFASLRAIETRRDVIRSANTGISGFINQRGDIMQSTSYWVPAVIRQKVNSNNALTFYVQHGDYIARISLLAGILVLLTIIITAFLRKRKTSELPNE